MGWFRKKEKEAEPEPAPVMGGYDIYEAVQVRAVKAPLSNVAMNETSEYWMRSVIAEGLGVNVVGLPSFFGASIDGVTISENAALDDGVLEYD